MSKPVTIPNSNEIDRRIRDCRDELAALKRLRKLAQTVEQADTARDRRICASGQTGGGHGE